ncbi:hypothetical protein SCD_n01741 [Sulfuricella denitrificans skB26]|uniref:Uncharacterized protein n=1 Tax=Sulfuricella denitrificans (strain DSM 22764 / NBRC 105220 / skB26) TaxID=1163617 RepID=S6AHD1_SULDS|nr:hypothetical protein [Sulfuricella denitrificans]BAN35556.1 hypothetical protein SCD_n01741 [Sulfuricella denitrificans skB26]
MNETIQEIRKGYLKAFSGHIENADETPIYSMDLVVFGLMDRNIGLIEALPKLIEDENIHALAPLLRVQLDGLLRLHAFRMVAKPNDLAGQVIKGVELRKLTDDKGNKFTDRHLVNSLMAELPWVESMYDTLCGWVHFSETHIFAAASEGKGEGVIEIGIGGFRKRVKPELFQEAIEATKAIHKATIEIIEAYFALPRNL